MRPDQHLRMYEFEDHYWWFVGRQVILTSLLDRYLKPVPDRRILDVGCGSGATLAKLAAYGRVDGLDPAVTALELSRRRGLRRLVAGDAKHLPFATNSYHLVTALDVLEHIDSDIAALREIARVLAPGGQVLLTVPAYQFLWSEHDEALDHYRRYTARQVAHRIAAAGLLCDRLTYCITFLLPAATLLRLGQRLLRRRDHEPRCALVELPPLLNRLCLATLHLEARWLPYLDLPCGVSILCLAHLPD